jgi:hypothetical protein
LLACRFDALEHGKGFFFHPLRIDPGDAQAIMGLTVGYVPPIGEVSDNLQPV